MGLEKAIEHNKEHRKPYRGSKSFDTTCRPHGSCSYCRDARTYSSQRRRKIASEKLYEATK